jgi:hypothetical protein
MRGRCVASCTNAKPPFYGRMHLNCARIRQSADRFDLLTESIPFVIVYRFGRTV